MADLNFSATGWESARCITAGLNDGAFCFASEVKGLLAVTRDIHEMPPGHSFDGETNDEERRNHSPA